MRRVPKLLLLASAVAALLVPPGSASASVPPPDPAWNCALAYGDYYGVGIRQEGDVVQDYSVSAESCISRSGNTIHQTETWTTSGHHLYGGSLFYYQLFDCTIGSVAVTNSLAYPQAPSGTSASTAINVAVLAGHQYAARVTGGGSIAYGGTTAVFTRFPQLHTPPLITFLAQSGDCF